MARVENPYILPEQPRGLGLLMTADRFERVKAYVEELGLDIIGEDEAEQLIVLQDEERGIASLVLDCEDDLLIAEQPVMAAPGPSSPSFRRLLQLNRQMIHGAFALDDAGETVVFRDTLQLENLDLNELEAMINALALALADFADELIQIAKEGGAR